MTPLTPSVTEKQRAIIDRIGIGQAIKVRLVANTSTRPFFTPGKLYVARRNSVGRALTLLDDKGNERVILLGEPCGHHPTDRLSRDIGLVSYWVAAEEVVA